jgi:hypothetical protein
MKNSQGDLEPAGEQMTLFSPAGSRNCANRTAQQENDWGKKTSDTSGRRCCERLKRLNHVTLWARTFSALLIGMEGWSSTRCKLTWRMQATRSRRTYFQLRVSALPTNDTGYGLLPTPVSYDSTPGGPNNHYRGIGNMGRHMPHLLPTPDTQNHRDPDSLRQITKDAMERGSKRGISLHHALGLGMLPTPTAASDAKGGCTRPDPKRQNDTLAHAIHQATNGKPGKTSQLNPRFVAEMMGFPPNWLELPFQSTETNQSKPTETP